MVSYFILEFFSNIIVTDKVYNRRYHWHICNKPRHALLAAMSIEEIPASIYK